MAETVKIEGGGDGILIAGGFVIFLIIISLVVWALNPDIFKKKEGDDCKVKDGDIRGTYEIDDKGKCVLKSCDSGWKVLGDKCSKIIDEDEVPDGPAPGPDGPAPGPDGPTPAPAPGPSKYVKSASFNCHGHTDVNVTEWFRKFIDKTKGGSDNSKYLCSTGGKYENSCTNSGSYPGSQTVFSDEGLYDAAKTAGSTAGTCPNKWHGVTITGKNGVRSVWSWGSHLNMSDVMSTRVARSKYVKSAMFKCHSQTPVDVTQWFKDFIDRTEGGTDLKRYLCSASGKYSTKCNPGNVDHPGSHTVFSDEGLYEAAKTAGSTAGTCPGMWHGVIITGVNGATSTWKWGGYLDMSRILTVTVPPSKYVKAAEFKCASQTPVDVTEWFKQFIDGKKASSDMTKYLCGPGGSLEGKCNPGNVDHPGSHTVFSDEGLYEAAKTAGSTAGTCPGMWHGVIITGVNGATSTWKWGGYLDMSGILKGDPLSTSDRAVINEIIAIQNPA